MKKIYEGHCPATAGELIQGFWGEREYLISYCVPLYSHASLEYQEERQAPIFPLEKAQKIKERTLAHLGIEEKEASHLHLTLHREMPIGKGMSSSTADLGAVMAACFAYAHTPLDTVWMAKAASRVEPTDASYFSECTIFDSTNGEVKQKLGKMMGMKALILEPENSLDTIQWRKTKDYTAAKKAWHGAMDSIWEKVISSFQREDMEAVACCATENSRLNQGLLPKPHLDKVIEIALDSGAWGVNAAHSGTILSLLMPASLDTGKLVGALEQHGILKDYTKRYELPIIAGGLTTGRGL